VSYFPINKLAAQNSITVGNMVKIHYAVKEWDKNKALRAEWGKQNTLTR
jgi:hypothetical protein